ncbi:MAG: MotA/TolQ/ExbB proton channel family protein [Deltaproteobacteria bacterium]|nr:MotA/TolQ/ExbB proton channel family protein [Deltaproteobacteria bacterium]
MIDKLLQIALLGSTWVLYLLLFLSVVSIAAMVERWWFFRVHSDDGEALRGRISKALLAGKWSEAEAAFAASRGLPAKIISPALAWRDGGAEAVTDAVDSELGRVRKQLERGASLLGTLGNNAPFIGLFGTVLGVIEAFHHLGEGASKSAMSNVMSGIAEALVATGVGIFVALPAVVAFNLIQKRIGEVEAETTSLSKLVTAYLKKAQREGVVIPASHAVAVEPNAQAAAETNNPGNARVALAD